MPKESFSQRLREKPIEDAQRRVNAHSAAVSQQRMLENEKADLLSKQAILQQARNEQFKRLDDQLGLSQSVGDLAASLGRSVKKTQSGFNTTYDMELKQFSGLKWEEFTHTSSYSGDGSSTMSQSVTCYRRRFTTFSESIQIKISLNEDYVMIDFTHFNPTATNDVQKMSGDEYAGLKERLLALKGDPVYLLVPRRIQHFAFFLSSSIPENYYDPRRRPVIPIQEVSKKFIDTLVDIHNSVKEGLAPHIKQ